MADERIAEERTRLIEEIRRLQDELSLFGVRRESIPFYKAEIEDLAEILESVREQLKQRKKFLGVK